MKKLQSHLVPRLNSYSYLTENGKDLTKWMDVSLYKPYMPASYMYLTNSHSLLTAGIITLKDALRLTTLGSYYCSPSLFLEVSTANFP